ncbi:hydrogen gas-evolving membrane-bound hydrogenase subunit E [Nocardiopsis rhodophaea]|uniref:hydrogen gas-evolving membrane-bound hydrogenase subunit E n=1 Tax=Nocardiopsis rhodophaea TaxID=280238 RepID=UPI0031DC8C91
MLLPFILLLHAAVAPLLPRLVRALGPRAFLVAALPPATAAIWALVQAPAVVAGTPVTTSVSWVPGLGIGFDLLLDPLALAMAVLISGVGAVIFGYCAWYFHADERALGRLAALLVLFSGAMLGVVTTDNLFALYVFWELTSVTSFLLIGHDDRKENARRAATQSLVVTAGFGLLMLIGFVLLGHIGGSYRISVLLADPPLHSALLPVALVLILAGAFAKSAQAPLHFWLPGAMVAPTPVSAYLHAAAMVKGGVYLIARLAPGFADVDPWRAIVLTVGLATMVIGGWRALRQDDLKLLLAYGTVSQLGFLTLLAGAGTKTAAAATIGVLLAHGFFKSTLFLTVGIIDHQTGTRSISLLTGIGRRMPVLAGAAVLAAASMAGVPPLLGFIGKEAALEAFLPDRAPGTWPLTAPLMLTGLVVASILTFGYSARFAWGAFADKETVSERRFAAPAAAFVAAPVLTSALGLLLGLYPVPVDAVARGHAALFTAGEPYDLALWHGLTPTLGLTALVIAAGVLVFVGRSLVTRVQNAMPRWLDAEVGYHVFLRVVYTAALRVTRRTQSGSLPVYLGIILATLLALPGSYLVVGLVSGGISLPRDGDGPLLWNTPLEGLVAVVISVTAIATIREHRRFGALILISATGFGVAGLFVLYGAPDLALTLVLVETLTTIILLFVLRRLPATFGTRPNGWGKRLTVLLCAAAGTFIAVALWTMTAARTDAPISRDYARHAAEAGGDNLVNLIIADFRAMDTFGEIVVLATAAIAVASLVLLNRRARVVVEEPEDESVEDTPAAGESPAAATAPGVSGPGPGGAATGGTAHEGADETTNGEPRGGTS